MNSEVGSLEVRGKTIERGDSLFDDRDGRVLWYDGVEEGFVKLRTNDGPVEMSESAFRVHLIAGDVVIESQPNGERA